MSVYDVLLSFEVIFLVIILSFKHLIMVEVFKTNIQSKAQARLVAGLLKKAFLEAHINFDLDDCDKILRIEGINESSTPAIVADLKKLGFKCEVLN